VRYLGKLDAAEVRGCLRQADVFLIPSLWENCPYACLEAMAAGRAIVSSDAGGLPELIRDGENGLVAPREDVAAYVRCVERLIEDRRLRERLGEAARRTVAEAHGDVRIAEVTVSYYRAVLAGGREDNFKAKER
jgi:glycosyltransferase involved in cell wall biosynthesis